MTNNIDAKAIDVLKKELEFIEDSTLQAFFYNALAVAPQSFHNDADLLEEVKRAYHILRGMLEKRNVSGAVRDALLGTALICEILSNEFKAPYHALHTVGVRAYLTEREVNKDIQAGLWENIMRAVESHEGPEGASPILDAKPGTAEYEIASAFSVARLPYISINWEEITHGNETTDEKEA